MPAIRNALLASAIAIMLMPIVTQPIMAITLGLDLRASIVLSMILFLVTTLVALGSAGPAYSLRGTYPHQTPLVCEYV